MNNETFGNKLKKARIKANKTQEQVANEMNISRTNISKYENGDLEPNLHTLKKISEIYKVSIDYILGISEENKKEKNLTEEEEYILSLYNGLSVPNKREVEDLAKKLGEEQAKRKEKIS